MRTLRMRVEVGADRVRAEVVDEQGRTLARAEEGLAAGRGRHDRDFKTSTLAAIAALRVANPWALAMVRTVHLCGAPPALPPIESALRQKAGQLGMQARLAVIREPRGEHGRDTPQAS